MSDQCMSESRGVTSVTLEMQEVDRGIAGGCHLGGTKRLQVIFWKSGIVLEVCFRRTVMIERQGVVVA
jgi:hypothetical protein